MNTQPQPVAAAPATQSGAQLMPPPPLPQRYKVVHANELVSQNPKLYNELWFLLACARIYSFDEGPISPERARALANEHLFESPLSAEDRIRSRDATINTLVQQSKEFWYYIMHCVVEPLVSDWMDMGNAVWGIVRGNENHRLQYFLNKIDDSRRTRHNYDFAFACSMEYILDVEWIYTQYDHDDYYSQNLKTNMRSYFRTKLALLADLIYKSNFLKSDMEQRNPGFSEEQKDMEVWKVISLDLAQVKCHPRMRALIDLPVCKWPCHNNFHFEREQDMLNTLAVGYRRYGGVRIPQTLTDGAKQRHAQLQREEAEAVIAKRARQAQRSTTRSPTEKDIDEARESAKLEEEGHRAELARHQRAQDEAALAVEIGKAWAKHEAE